MNEEMKKKELQTVFRKRWVRQRRKRDGNKIMRNENKKEWKLN